MDIFKLSEDLANETRSPFTPSSMWDFLDTHNLGSNVLGLRGIVSRELGNTFIFRNEDEKNKAAQSLQDYKSAIVIGGKSPESSWVTADDPVILEKVLRAFKTQCEIAKRFLITSRETGRVSFYFINEKFAEIQKRNPILRFSGSIERPTLSLINIPIPYATLEDEIETKAYLVPFLAGEGLKWTRSRDCEECGRLFFYKLERARYCSQACRMRANHKARKEK